MSTDFKVKAGLPFSRSVRLVDGKNVWPTLDDFEVRMHIRVAESSTSNLVYDFTPHLESVYEGNDIVISWSLSGSDTRSLRSGFYDLVISDPGAEDQRAISLAAGKISLSSLVTSGSGAA